MQDQVMDALKQQQRLWYHYESAFLYFYGIHYYYKYTYVYNIANYTHAVFARMAARFEVTA